MSKRTGPDTSPSRGDSRLARVGLYTAFASLGVTAAYVPAIIPAAEVATGSDLSATVSALFIGLLVGVLVSTRALGRSVRLVIVVGCVLQAVGIATLSFAGVAFVAFLGAFVAGLGFGLAEASASVAARALAESTSSRTTVLLSSLTATLATCAAATPLVIMATGAALPSLGALCIIPLSAAALLSRMPDRVEPGETAARDVRRTLALVLPFAIALPLYVGVETVLSGWSAVISQRVLTIDPAFAALGTSAFWALMAVGRFIAARLDRAGVMPRAILTAGSILATAALGVAGAQLASPLPDAWSGTSGLVALGVAVVALAPSYGLLVAMALDRLPPSEGKAAVGALVACGAVGGAALPSLILATGASSVSLTTFSVCAVLCLAVPLLAGRQSRRA